MADPEDRIVRRLLELISDNAEVSQRRLAREIGIAIGSVNWYLKRCVNKGLVKLRRVPSKRYLYFVTPQGLDEKSRLTANFLQSSLELYRRGREQCAAFFDFCDREGKLRVFLAGDGDLAEIAVLARLAMGSGPPAAVIDKNRQRRLCAGVCVVESLDDAILHSAPDAILMTELNDPANTYAVISAELNRKGLANDIIHVPPLLNFKPPKSTRD